MLVQTACSVTGFQDLKRRQEEKFKTADNGHPPDRLSRHSGNLSRFELTEKPTTDTQQRTRYCDSLILIQKNILPTQLNSQRAYAGVCKKKKC